MPTHPPAARKALAHLARWFGPAMARPTLREAVRAGTGAGLALALSGLLLLGVHAQVADGSPHGLLLIAPLGASAFLLFAVPNSPLAQPWSAITGNTVSALIAITAVLSGLPQLAAIGLAIAGAILAMAMLRAMHPPGAAVALAIGIGLQNFPEGIAVAMPLRREGVSRLKCFWFGQLSAAVEPIAAVLGALAVIAIRPLLPYALAFAAGAMIYVVVEELIPEAQRRGRTDLATTATMLGFAVMMWLDVALG